MTSATCRSGIPSAIFAGLALAIGTLLVTAKVHAAEKPVTVGATVANLTFRDIRYLNRSLDDFPDRKAFVLVFTTTTCPLVQRYLPTLHRLEKEYRDKGVQFLAVNVGPDDSIVRMAAQAVEHGVEFPFVKDMDGSWVRALGVRFTPEVVVLDAKRGLRYRGRIDDQYRPGGARAVPTRDDLKVALEEVLAGKEVTVKQTHVDGCRITPEEPRPVVKAVTYADHVAPLMNKHCVECHRPWTAAPFALQTYDQVAGKARAVAEVVTDGRMPPWFASPQHQPFTNRRGLSAGERDLIVHWVRSGKPRGDDSKLPPPAPPAAGWRIGEPDLVLKLGEHDIPAEGLLAYRYAVIPHVFLEDTWVQGVEIRADNPRVLHHCNMSYVSLAKGFDLSNFITGTVPGGEAMTLQEGIGYRIPKGSMLALEIHYVTTGKPEKCRISVGLKHARGTIHKQLRHLELANFNFAIPAGAPAHPVTAARTLRCDADILALFAHMHLRGKDMTFKAKLPDGTAETLLMVPNYSFDWQVPYRLDQGQKRLPKGTRLECIAHFDNSAFNPFNPDPKATVRFGLQTTEEMMMGFVFYTDAGEDLKLRIDPKTGRAEE